jgi:hypothetical protein
MSFSVSIKKPESLPSPPNKPYCLVSLQNSFEINVLGYLGGGNSPKGKDFVIRTPITLPLGWSCIEMFPFFNLDHWQPEFAQIWAEKDIMRAVIAQQFKDSKFNELDPNVAARKRFSNLLKEYKNLLDSDPDREEILQNFLKENPSLLCPTYLKVWPKLKLGKKITDFVFKDATGDYLLVEIEKSTASLFLTKGSMEGDTSRELKHAQNQVVDWKRYLEDNLSTVQRELGLSGISANPRSLIVIGRSHSLTEENRRKLVTMENENPKVKILTYDDVLENTKAVIENLLGPLWDNLEDIEVYYLPNQRSL